MVVKRQCSFCAGEVEPGTGTMFVKRDGTVFYFCSGSCRKQQLHLGRVGHRLKWTRAHAIKRAQQQSSSARLSARAAAAAKASAKPESPAPAAKPAAPAPSTPAADGAPAATPEPAAEAPAPKAEAEPKPTKAAKSRAKKPAADAAKSA